MRTLGSINILAENGQWTKKKPANGACASIHPHNSIVQWKPSGFTPHDSGFPLICDPNGLQTSTDIMSISSGFVNCLRHTHLHSLYNLHRIMLNPSSNSKKSYKE
jgi:hypothetical protein